MPADPDARDSGAEAQDRPDPENVGQPERDSARVGGGEQPRQDAEAEDPGGRVRRLRERVRELNTDPSLVGAITRMRRRLPGDDRFGDRISTEGRSPVELAGREVLSLTPDQPSAIQQLGLGALQVWQSLSEGIGRGRGPTPVALVFTDLVEFSSWALEAGDRAAVTLLREAGDAIEGALSANDGEVVKRLGDGIMAAFEHPEPAVRAVLDAREALAGIEVEGYRPRMRAGIHYGHPRKVGGDYLGVDVNVAARVGEGAKADQLLVSETTCAMIDGAEFHFGRAKRLRAPGAPKDLRVREVSRATP